MDLLLLFGFRGLVEVALSSYLFADYYDLVGLLGLL